MDWSVPIVLVQTAMVLWLAVANKRLRHRLDTAYLFLRVERNNIVIRDRELATTRAERDFLRTTVERLSEQAA